ncbi:hypothetical protein K2173_008053 [Erythroxylum novogranatense]|uniref:RING-type E3 ubiquitin transferase n=1 Tax=Erythroxylum novogranatense TaxID=1862640 RepID=A0AAV8T965_9ROSI|nr:hypothetical protein K2173_008053 [Erythroxylum novogranatense]
MTVKALSTGGSSPLHLVSVNHGIFRIILILFLSSLPSTIAQKIAPPAQQPPPPVPFALGQNFKPPMAIFTVVVVSAFFLLGFVTVYFRHCRIRGSVDSSANLILGGARRSRRAGPGLEAAVIDTFPTFQYSSVKGLKIGKGSLECAVCLNEFEDSETLRLIPKCNHVFHPDCIGEWLASHTTCPVCRANLLPKPGDSQVGLILNFEPENGSIRPEQRPDVGEEALDRVVIQVADVNNQNMEEPAPSTQSQDVNLLNPAIPNRSLRSWSTGWRIGRLFPRSHSTGHSLVQPGENLDRFTLILPEEVRNHCVAFPRVSSSRRGYRSKSVGVERSKNFELFDQEKQPDRNSRTPAFISRIGSGRSSKRVGDQDRVNVNISSHPLKSLSRSIRSSPFDRLFLGLETNEHDGERSTDPLKPVSHV